MRLTKVGRNLSNRAKTAVHERDIPDHWWLGTNRAVNASSLSGLSQTVRVGKSSAKVV